MFGNIKRNFILILFFDFCLAALSMISAFGLRYGNSLGQDTIYTLFWVIPVSVVIKLGFFYFFDLYKGMWRYTSIKDLVNIIKACTISTLIIITMLLFKNRFEGVSRSVFVIDWFFTVFSISALRLTVRFYYSTFSDQKELFNVIKELFLPVKNKENYKRTMIIGAGDCGEKIYREIRYNSNLPYNVIGFLDDNPSKIGRKIHGMPVLDNTDSIKKYVKNADVENIIIAVPSANAQELRRIVNLCIETEADYKIVPGMGELINGDVSIKSIRDVEYRDVLGRDPVKLDNKSIGNYIEDRIVLITGAAGSIGSGLCRQICKYKPKEVILFDRAESPLYEIDMEIRNAFPELRIVHILGDIQDKQELYSVFSKRNPQIVFHAAAYKHVPILEVYPWKAVNNNIKGTWNVVDAANEFKCEKFVFVSTDKAVNPVNVMGASKRVCEMIVQNNNRKNSSGTSFITVRFGNVIGSAGSVIPLFKRQIKAGGPVTVTHPEIIRYFMLTTEACQLILQAGAMGHGGEIFLLDMGKPVKIDEMARDLIKFSGFEPDVDIKIEYVGLRPGEKLYEELLTEGEDVLPTDHNKIMVLNSRVCNINEISSELKLLEKKAFERKGEDIREILHEIVPEYTPPSFIHKN